MPVKTQATSRKPTPESQSLPVPTMRTGDFSEDEFFRVDNVPVFAEHSTETPDGRPLTFGPRELQAVVDRCNRRIAETGDYAVVCFGHTSTEPGMPEPDLAGFAGPFSIGRMVLPDSKIRYVILATFWIYKTEAERFKRYPRRSPELWIEDTYEEMFLDPIALLKSEVPRLDMGLLYSRHTRPTGKQVLKYSAVAPASTNAFVPTVADAEQPKRHAAETDTELGDMNMGSAEEVAEIVLDAIQQLPVWRFMESMMTEQNMAGEGGAAMATGGAAPDMADDPSLTSVPPATADNVAAPPEIPGAAPEVPPTAAAPAMPPTPPAVGSPSPAVPPQAAGGPDSLAPPVAAGDSLEESDPMPPAEEDSEPSDLGADVDGGGAPGEEETQSPAERERMQRYEAIDKAMEGMTDEEVESYCSHRKKKYSAGALAEPGGDAPSGDSIPAEPSISESSPGESSVEKYSRKLAAQGMPMAYAKKFAELQSQLEGERAARVDSERSQELERLAFVDGYMIDVNDEMEVCRYSKMTDKRFKEHVSQIKKNYRRNPSGVILPPGLADHAETAGRLSYQAEHREKYAKEAVKICARLREQGKSVAFEDILEDVTHGRAGKYSLNGRTLAAK